MDWTNSEDAAALGLSIDISAEAWAYYLANYLLGQLSVARFRLAGAAVIDAPVKLTSTIWNFNSLH